MHLRTQLFIDAEARMDTYEDKDGVKRTQLNLLMRTCMDLPAFK